MDEQESPVPVAPRLGDRTEMWWYVNGVEIVTGVFDPWQVQHLSAEIWDRLGPTDRWFCLTRDVATGETWHSGNDEAVGREVTEREGLRWPEGDVAYQRVHGPGTTLVPDTRHE